jgi:indole-3-acetate monooxygenase
VTLEAGLAAIPPLIPRIESERRLPRELVDAFVAAGIFKLLVPRAYGGAEVAPERAIETFETIARVDGSAGWCAMIGATTGLCAYYLDEATAREIYTPADAITCGVFAPMGHAVADADGGGVRVSGRWSFGSGCEHAHWRMGGAMLGDTIVHVMLRADQTRVIDTWDAVGLRGTGSHDYVAEDVLVPRTRVFSMITSREVPFFGLLAAGIAAVGLGVARAAIDVFAELARTKQLPGGKRTIAHRELVQVELARAEAQLGAARAYLYAQLQGGATLVERARLRLAANHATETSAQVTGAMFHAAGGGAVYARSPLQRYLRDAQVVAQHVMVSSLTMTTVGRVLLGVESDTSTL